ncbi:MAG: hypothetical protein Q4D38_02970 [Planctomycetia bacterium]|nr:hypothetical protein [Planctomycetia bacterium]
MSKIAFLFGLEEYFRAPCLSGADESARRFAEQLENFQNFERENIHLYRSRTYPFCPLLRETFARALAQRYGNAFDTLLLGVWARRIFHQRKLWLCPMCVRDEKVERMGLPLDELASWLRAWEVKNVTLVLDLWRHTPGSAPMHAEEALALERIAREGSTQGRLFRVLASCSPEQYSHELPDTAGETLFSRAVEESLALKKPHASIMSSEFLGDVRKRVEQLASGLAITQTPWSA